MLSSLYVEAVGTGVGSGSIGVGFGVGSGIGSGIVSFDGMVSLIGTIGTVSFNCLLPRYVVFNADGDSDRTIVLFEFDLS